MRSSVLLLVGFAMVAGGIGIALGVAGGVLPGIALAVLGLVVKGVGFLLGDPSATTESGRGPQTLAGQHVERPRAGIPVGRAAVRRRVPGRVPGRVPSRARAGVVRPLSDVRRPVPAPMPPPAPAPAVDSRARHHRAS